MVDYMFDSEKIYMRSWSSERISWQASWRLLIETRALRWKILLMNKHRVRRAPSAIHTPLAVEEKLSPQTNPTAVQHFVTITLATLIASLATGMGTEFEFSADRIALLDRSSYLSISLYCQVLPYILILCIIYCWYFIFYFPQILKALSLRNKSPFVKGCKTYIRSIVVSRSTYSAHHKKYMHRCCWKGLE